MEQLKTQVLALIAQACAQDEIRANEKLDLLDSGLLDSLALITLLEGLEDTLGVELQPSQIPRERWRTPASIIALVQEALSA